jgi:hypothetical protein
MDCIKFSHSAMHCTHDLRGLRLKRVGSLLLKHSRIASFVLIVPSRAISGTLISARLSIAHSCALSIATYVHAPSVLYHTLITCLCFPLSNCNNVLAQSVF